MQSNKHLGGPVPSQSTGPVEDPREQALLQEAHWQRRWEQAGLHAAPKAAGAGKSAAKPYYVLEMWPYPSGDLHMGHVRNYTLGDVFARFMRLQGRRVLHPMGWDAFGLPAENQAIKEKVAPQTRTPQNIARMRTQMQRLGLSYDWQREQASFEPSYYRWNQWFFLKMLERDLVYRRQSQVNYCPGCKTTLANEQVGDDNTCWRGHAGVTQRTIPEWAFRITAFAEELLADLDTLTAWPDRVVQQQRHWIGKSVGATLSFQTNVPGQAATQLEVFTTRPDTLFGCTYLVLAAEHSAVTSLCSPEQREAVQAFVARIRDQDRVVRTAEGGQKEGVFLGSYATHPLTGAKLPLWLANFVLPDYGTGAVMAVPAHDARDFAFAHTYGLPMRQSVGPADAGDDWGPLATWQAAHPEEGVLVDAGALTGTPTQQARAQMLALAEAQGFGRATTSWHLRDWGFSRQRYWGTPIPIVHCSRCGAVPVPEAELPVRLPDYHEVDLTGQGGAPLAKLEKFVATACPRCQGPARREVDTMDTFVDSSWYFARYLSPNDATRPFDPEEAKAWLPADLYVGGPEHAVMHLLYFRFFTRVMHQLGLVPTPEPVKRLLTQGMVNALAYRCPSHGYLWAHELAGERGAPRCPRCPPQAPAVQVATEKMSKSKYNGVDPLALMDRYGADTARLYTLFAAPPEKDIEWSDSGVEGQHRFLMRLRRLSQSLGPRVRNAAATCSMADLTGSDAALRRLLHRTLEKVGAEMAGRNHFNTAIAALMELTNAGYEQGLHKQDATVHPGVGKEWLLVLAQMLSPMAPHIAEDIWAEAGGEGLVAGSRWPAVDPKATEQDVVRIAVQVGGKLRGTLDVPPSIERAALLELARTSENVQRFLTGKQIVKEVVVPGRLVNFVVRP